MTDPLHDRVGSRLRIERLRARYLVAADHPAPEQIKARLDETIAEWLPQALGVALAGALPETAPDVWMVRRLHVDVDVNVARDGDAVLPAIADRVGEVLLRTIRGGADGQDVVWFPDRAAYLACFLSDRVDGRADRWYYEPFQGLGLLPLSAALRTAICDAPETGLVAMRRLAPEAMGRVLGALTVQDARAVLDVFAAAAPSGDPGRCIEAAWSAWQGLLAGDEARDALRLYLAALSAGDASGRPLRDAARAVVRLDRLLRDASPDRHARILGALTRTDPFALHRAAGASDAEALAPWRSGRREWLREVVADLAVRILGPVGRLVPANERRDTPCGGAFFLLPILDELPLDAAAESWPDLGEVPAAALVRFLILMKCLGAPRALAAFHDSVLRDLIGIGAEVSAEACFEWQARLTESDRNRWLETLEDWRVERGLVTIARQFLVRVASDGRPAVVLIDGARGIWRRVVPDSRRQPARVIRRLLRVPGLVGPGSDLVCDPEFIAALHAESPDLRVAALAGAGPGESPEARDAAAWLDHLPDDLEYLRFPPQVGVAGALDRALMVAAQGGLRSFAWRFPGFGLSSFPYLHANFLDVPAALEDRPDRRVVTLGRPPLGVIMNVAGLSRATYRLGWLDERPFLLFPEG